MVYNWRLLKYKKKENNSCKRRTILHLTLQEDLLVTVRQAYERSFNLKIGNNQNAE